MIEAFAGAGRRSPARFDYAKLENMNGQYMRAMADDGPAEPLVAALPYLPAAPAMAAQLDDASGRNCARACRPEGTRENLDRTDRRARSSCSSSARSLSTRKPTRSLTPRPRPSRGAGCRGSPRSPIGRRSRRGLPCAPMSTRDRRETRPGRAALARRADRPVDVAGNFRRARRLGPRGKPWAYRRSRGLNSASRRRIGLTPSSRTAATIG